MPVPTYDEFIEPLLRYLAAHSDGAAIADVYEALANEMNLTSDDRAELLPSRSKNRIGWAQDRLKRASRSESPRRGFWEVDVTGNVIGSEVQEASRGRP